MIEFGRFFLVLAACLCTFAIFADLLAGWKKNTRLSAIGRYATIGVFLCLTSAVIVLLRLLLDDDFSVAYVASHSSQTLSVFHKIGALWACSAGTLLLWLWLQVGFVCAVFLKTPPEALAFSSRGRSIANFVSAFFLQALIHDNQPFAILDVALADGAAGSESLGNLAMVWSYPLFIVACAALIIPFAWSFGFFKSDPDIHVNTMLSKARGWSFCALVFLTAGIALAGWGNYQESGVMCSSFANLQLIPWFFALVMFFCYRLYRSRGPMGIWAALTSILTFSLCVYGVFLMRHADASSETDSTDGGQGKFFVVLLIHIWIIAAVMLLRRHFRKDKKL